MRSNIYSNVSDTDADITLFETHYLQAPRYYRDYLLIFIYGLPTIELHYLEFQFP